MTEAFDLDTIRDMVGFAPGGANDIWSGDAPNWVVISETGGVLNHLDEMVGETIEEIEVIGVEGMDQRNLAELSAGDFERVALMLRLSKRVAKQGDELHRLPDDGERYKVLGVHVPRVGGEAVCYNLMLERVMQ